MLATPASGKLIYDMTAATGDVGAAMPVVERNGINLFPATMTASFSLCHAVAIIAMSAAYTAWNRA